MGRNRRVIYSADSWHVDAPAITAMPWPHRNFGLNNAQLTGLAMGAWRGRGSASASPH